MVSFGNFPGRLQLRAVSRSLRRMTTMIFGGWAIDDLSQSAHNIKDRVENLQPPSTTRQCISCDATLTAPTVLVFDAGQAYEMLSRSSIINNLTYLLRRAEDTNTGIQQVLNTRKAIVSTTRDFHRHQDDRIVLATKSINRCVKAYLNFRIYRIGTTYIIQQTGVPIGGFLSAALMGLDFSAAESRFDCGKWRTWEKTQHP